MQPLHFHRQIKESCCYCCRNAYSTCYYAILILRSSESRKRKSHTNKRRREGGISFLLTVCAYCILPIMVARKGYLSGFSLLAFSVLHSSGSFLFLRSSNIDNCYCAMSTTLLLEGRETYFTTAM